LQIEGINKLNKNKNKRETTLKDEIKMKLNF